MLGNQVEAIELSLACLHGGWVLVPVNWHWVSAELAYVLGDADAAAVVADGRWLDVMTASLAEAESDVRVRLVVDGEATGFERYEQALVDSSAEEPDDVERGGPIFYTSGTTVRPKGVRPC